MIRAVSICSGASSKTADDLNKARRRVKQYEIEGTFAINSPTGFGASDGLMIFSKMTDDKGVVLMGTAEQLEAKAMAGEAIEAAFAAKRAANAKNKK